MIKTKIFRVLPYWLLFLVLTTAAQGVASAFNSPPNLAVASASEISAEPQVLGASISIRGEEDLNSGSFVKAFEPELSSVSAKSFLVFDLASGQNLLEKNTESKLSIASLTKLVTGLTIYNTVGLNKNFTVGKSANIQISPILKLKIGDEVSALDVFNAMLVGSCNDAAMALADFGTQQTGTDFVQLMNQQAQFLGMANSHFSNPVGFDSQYNFSTASDLKILIQNIEKLAVFTNLGRRTSYEFSGSFGQTYFTKATNQLLKEHPDIYAIKTGYTENAGGAMVTKTQIGERQIVIVVLDSQNRELDTLKLKEQASQDFLWQ